jgi:hypothetical protein
MTADLPGVFTASEVALLSRTSVEHWWALVRENRCPIEALRLGRSVRFPTRRVLELLDLTPDEAARILDEGA